MIDFKDCLSELPEVGKYKRFMIGIDNLYFNGDGYKSQKNINDYDRIIEYLSEHLTEIIQGNYFGKLYIDIKEHGSSSGCSEVKSKIPQIEPAYVYLHPMEFTGMLYAEDVENLCKFINSYVKRIGREDVHAHISYTEDTYHLNDKQYMELIFKNSKNIIARVQEYLNKLSPRKKEVWLKYEIRDVGFDFAKTCGLTRDFENRCGYSSSNTDVVVVENIIRMAIDNGLIK